MRRTHSEWSTLGFAVSTFVTCVALITLVAAGASTADEVSSTRSGGYLGVSVFGGLPLWDSDEIILATPEGPLRRTDSAVGFGVRAGWRVHPLLALEAQYEWVNDINIRVRNRTCAEIGMQSVTGNAKLFLPFEAVHPYALAGVGAVFHDVQVNDTTFPRRATCTTDPSFTNRGQSSEFTGRVGAGFDLYLHRNVLLNLEYTVLLNEEETLSSLVPMMSIGAGLQFRF